MSFRIRIHRDSNQIDVKNEHDQYVCQFGCAKSAPISSVYYNGDETFTAMLEDGHGHIFRTSGQLVTNF